MLYIGGMENSDIARIAYLLLLLVAVGGYFVTQNRESLSKLAQQAAIWGLIFVGVLAGYGLWGDIQRGIAPRQQVLANGQIEIPRMFDGHFYLTAIVNGEQVEFVVDTGATDVVLTREDAARIGIDLDGLAYTGTANTANGVVRTARARVGEMRVGGIVDRDLRVLVNGGEMETSLLGMAYLRRFERIEIAEDVLILTR